MQGDKIHMSGGMYNILARYPLIFRGKFQAKDTNESVAAF
jgi:hypothetical protein